MAKIRVPRRTTEEFISDEPEEIKPRRKKPEPRTEEADASVEFEALSEAPREIAASEEQIEEAEARFERRAITLDPDTKSRLEKELTQIVDAWRDSRIQSAKLQEWNDLYENVTVQTDFPWPGASQLEPPVIKTKLREIHSVINRSTIRPAPFLVAEYAGPESRYQDTRDFVGDLEEFTEYGLKKGSNVHRVIQESLIPIMRDGTAVVQITWDTDWETVFDYKKYTSLDEWINDYPSAQNAGLSKDRYERIVNKLADGKEHEVRYEYDVAAYDAPRAYLVPLVDFVYWPIYVSDLKDTILHGKRIWYTEHQLRRFMTQKRFMETEDLELLLNGNGDEHDDDYSVSRDRIEGISRNELKEQAKEWEFYEFCYRTALTESDMKKGITRKYLIYFHRKKMKIHRIEPYPIRKGRTTYFIFRFIKRDNRLLGVSLVDDMADLALEVGIIHRQRINSRTISHVPTFKAKESAKSYFDPSNRENRFYPGKVFWIKQADDVVQFDIRPVDLSGSVDEELLLLQFIDQVTGSIAGQSGAANAVDPRAPARKEQLLLRQSSGRIDDYVAEFIHTCSEVGMHYIDLMYQYAPDRIKYFASREDGALIEKEMERGKLFNPTVQFFVNGTSVFMNADIEFQRNLDIHQIVTADPIFGAIPRIRRNSLQRVLEASRIQDEKDLLPTDEEAQIATGGKPRVPTEIEKQLESKQTIAEQRRADRLAEGALRQARTVEIENVRAANRILETEAFQSGSGTPVNGDRFPAGIPGPGGV